MEKMGGVCDSHHHECLWIPCKLAQQKPPRKPEKVQTFCNLSNPWGVTGFIATPELKRFYFCSLNFLQLYLFSAQVVKTLQQDPQKSEL